MKKTFAMMLALIMVFATVIATLGTTSAAEAEEGFMVATLNDITFDGDLTITKGANHKQQGETEVIETIGTPHLAEYCLDVALENGTIGAAYSLEKKELYIGIYGLEDIYTVDITVGGTAYTVDTAGSTVEGGEGYGQFASSNSDFTYEIILPLDEIAIKKVARGVGTDISITVESSMETTFEGQLLFSKYAAGFTYNQVNQAATMALSAGATDNKDGTVTLVNDGTNARVYSIPNLPNVTKNLVIKFDLTIDSMPASNTEDVANDAPTGWASIAAARLWIALKYRVDENVYMNIQNTADEGLVLNVYENSNVGFETVKKQHSVILGKETGEKMVLELEWSEANADGKYPLNVYVDGALVGSVENAMNIDKGLGKVSGVLQFNAQWTKTDGSNETINATWGNVSVNEISALYDADAYNALVNSQAGGGEDGGDGGEDGGDGTTPGGDGNDPTGDGSTPAGDASEGDDNASEGDDTSDDASDDSSDEEEEKKGCGSSIAGIGLVAVLGSAITAVVASKKKED